MRSSVLLIVTAVFLASAGLARAQTFYVSPTGSDSASGTSTSDPWRSVATAARSARAGDTILFAGGGRWTETLMPERNGTRGAPITFGAYGAGRPHLDGGIYLRNAAWLRFQDIAISGADQGICASATGTGTQHIVVRNLSIADVGIGINSANHLDGDWTIEGSTVTRTQDSGLILLGARVLVRGNTITSTGRSSTIPYGKHGIYAKGPSQRIVGNTIRGFQANGISIRFPDAVVERNTIGGGPIGIASFQDASTGGTSQIVANRISWVGIGGIYLDGSTVESFVIADNRIDAGLGVAMDLRAVRALTVARNIVVSGHYNLTLAAPRRGYSEHDNTWAVGAFSLGGRSLSLEAYRSASGQGAGDRVG